MAVVCFRSTRGVVLSAFPSIANNGILEHIQQLLNPAHEERMRNTITYYKNCLRVVLDNTPIVPQTSKTPRGPPLTSLTPNYLCLQCERTATAQDHVKHGQETSHRFCTLGCNAYVCSFANW